MTFKEFLADGAQAAYLPSVEQIADNWSNWLEAEILDGIDDETLYPRLVCSLESGNLSDDIRLQIGTDLTSLAWWRGPAIPPDLRARIDSVTRHRRRPGPRAEGSSPVTLAPGACPTCRRPPGPRAFALRGRHRLCGSPRQGSPD